MNHLTDGEIQSYLQSGRSERQLRVKDHLEICSDCRQKLLLYEKLGNIIAAMDSAPIRNGFEKAVLKRLEIIRQQRRITDILVAIAAIFGILIVGIAILLAPQLRQSVAGCLADVRNHMIQITSGSGGTAECLAVPLFGVVLLLLFAVIDRRIMAKLKTAKDARV